ncbi:hypothetical protein EXE59_16665 [Nocardioides eburneiflavus]|uniref:Uncharacterized protein n=1 Tax=Nocardioides eburneiflavus TaxID=2518372 RepID=A0A4Z1CCJ6_9ACTN|nr:hypothetical protein [Nocardioides eburneiflavus]TGN65406.1 hypothetical protein EXE59_16665 [Nocardioides eburneiflavus]
MASKDETKKALAWPLFDALVRDAPMRHLNPWEKGKFVPDFETLERLLGVPLLLEAKTTSGVPALALDVWVAYELRRAGLDPDAVWPREEPPRVVSSDILKFVDTQYKKTTKEIRERMAKGGNTFGGTLGASANLLGKNYLKQVDVIMSHWSTGPEIMISTKRMDSSFGKNAANRVEESYGDAKNLRLRHPQAACGFVYGLRSTCWDETPDKAAWLVDLLGKLGREDDAYHACALVVPQYGGEVTEEDVDEEAPVGDVVVPEADPELELELDEVRAQLDALPIVRLKHDVVPHEVSPARFFEIMLTKTLDNTPVNFHAGARALRDAGR